MIGEQLYGMAPRFMRGPVGRQLIFTIGDTLDELVQHQLDGLQQGNPLICESDNLPRIGRDRGMKRYSQENEKGYRRVLADWHRLSRGKGSHEGQLLRLQMYIAWLTGVYTPVDMLIVHQNGSLLNPTAMYHKLSADGIFSRHLQTPSNWDWDSLYPKDIEEPTITEWSRYWCAVNWHVPYTSAAIEYGSAHSFGDGSVYGGYVTSAQVADMAELLIDFGGPHSMLWGIILDPDSQINPNALVSASSDGTSNLPDGKWGMVVDPYDGKLTRNQSLIYVYDKGQG
jgi:hypothetical protein